MFKINFSKSELPKSELSYENLKILSKTHDLMLIMNGISGWFKTNPDCKTTDLEKKFRDDNLDIHLISAEANIDTNKFKIVLPYNMTEECDRMIIYSCRPVEYGLEEVLTHAKTYEENFERLNRAGIIMEKSITNLKEEEKEYEDQTNFEKLKNVSGLVELKIESFEEIFNGCIKFFKEKYDKEPELKIIGVGINGEPISALIHNNNICCPVGMIVGFKDNEKIVKYININDNSSWYL